MAESIRLCVPATSANLGPGFDLLGLALNQYTIFEIHFRNDPEHRIYQEDGSLMDLPVEKNLVRGAYLRALASLETEAPGLDVHFSTDIPPGRGFGSSACALVAGFAAANQYLKSTGRAEIPLEKELQILTDMEGHPDNVCPARLGGWVFSYYTEDGRIIPLRKNLPESLGLAAIVPDFQISTRKSRRRLPGSLSYPDILCNLQGVMLWLEFLHTGDFAFLRRALQMDRMHEPYRGVEIPGFSHLRQTLLSLGCYGTTISGSGPGILIYFAAKQEDEVLSVVRSLMAERKEPKGRLQICRPDNGGLKYLDART